MNAREWLFPVLASIAVAGWVVAAVVMLYASRLQRRYLDLRDKRP